MPVSTEGRVKHPKLSQMVSEGPYCSSFIEFNCIKKTKNAPSYLRKRVMYIAFGSDLWTLAVGYIESRAKIEKGRARKFTFEKARKKID